MSSPYDDGWYTPSGNTYNAIATPTCKHGSPTYLVCTECALEKDRKKHRVEALAKTLHEADGDLKQAFLESHAKVYDLMDENARLNAELTQVLFRENTKFAQHEQDIQHWKQRTYNAESTMSYAQSKLQELQAELLKMKKAEQERIDNAIAELEMKEKTIPAQSLRKVDLED